MLDEGELAARLGSLLAPEEFGRFVGELNGFFACVCRFPDGVVAAVDRVRSIPLFYGEDAAGVLYLSDDARWVRARLGNSQMDEVCKAEFALTGYVTGADTLSPGVKQLQAGEMLMLQPSSVGQTDVNDRIRVSRYYQWPHAHYLAGNHGDLLQQLDKVVTASFENLVRVADGRAIVVPLSGGYDSRLVVLMLKKLGYPNVMTFTYGQPGDWESEKSHEVACDLGVPWYFVTYDHDKWWDWFHSEERTGYFEFAHQLVSVPHVHDWPAVRELSEKAS